jgi:hypothetical protein
VWTCGTQGGGGGVYGILVVMPEEERSLGRPWHRREDNITMDLRKIGIDVANWTRLVQNTVHR